MHICKNFLFEFFFERTENSGQNVLFCASFVKLDEWQRSFSIRCFLQWTTKYFTKMCHNYQSMMCIQLLPIFVYDFLSDLSIASAWHCHSLYAALSSNLGVCGMWTCSLFLSFIYIKKCMVYMYKVAHINVSMYFYSPWQMTMYHA